MIGSGDILIIAEGTQAIGLANRLGPGNYVRCSDPYEALLKMSRRQWRTIVLAGARPGLAGLCRACRRLQCNAKLFAVCPPASEGEVKPLAGQVLDDYFIDPPTESDIRQIKGDLALAGEEPAAASQQARQSSGLSSREYSNLVDAAQSVADLEAHIAGLVARRSGTDVHWVPPDKAVGDVRPLLLAAGALPRLLAPTGEGFPQDEDVQGLLASLQNCLPALIANAKRIETLNRLAITDYLTGAYNRRYFYHLTDQILSRTKAKEFRAALLLFDIDNFKRYNDTYGHAAGDEILREVARLMRQTTRAQDVVARIGGDEFAVLFWDNAAPRQIGSALPTTAETMTVRFRRALANYQFPSLGPAAGGVLTISGGLAGFPGGGRSCRELLRSADEALRKAKDSGKDAIHLIGS